MLAWLEPAKVAVSPLFESRVPFQAWLTFLHINFLAHPGQVNSIKATQLEYARALLARERGQLFFSYKHSLTFTRLGE